METSHHQGLSHSINCTLKVKSSMNYKKSLVFVILLISGFSIRESFSQTMTYCTSSKFYKSPTSNQSVIPKNPSPDLEMVSASHVRNINQRDPFRIKGWVEVYVTNGRGGDPKGPYWMKINDFKCGEFMGT